MIYEIFMAIDGTDYEVNKPRLEKAIQAALEPLLASGRKLLIEDSYSAAMEFQQQLARFERRAGERK